MSGAARAGGAPARRPAPKPPPRLAAASTARARERSAALGVRSIGRVVGTSASLKGEASGSKGELQRTGPSLEGGLEVALPPLVGHLGHQPLGRGDPGGQGALDALASALTLLGPRAWAPTHHTRDRKSEGQRPCPANVRGRGPRGQLTRSRAWPSIGASAAPVATATSPSTAAATASGLPARAPIGSVGSRRRGRRHRGRPRGGGASAHDAEGGGARGSSACLQCARDRGAVAFHARFGAETRLVSRRFAQTSRAGRLGV